MKDELRAIYDAVASCTADSDIIVDLVKLTLNKERSDTYWIGDSDGELIGKDPIDYIDEIVGEN